MKRSFFSLLLGILTVVSGFSEAPAGYYDAADGKSGAELKTTMHRLVRQFLNLDFDGFTAAYWGENYFKTSDWNPEGYYWDMYSAVRLDQYDSGKLAREHCMPRSWWRTTDYGSANSDLNNLFPADFTANGKKSNLPLGETTDILWTNDVVKTGTNLHAGYAGKIFEPADKYKGDFARTYMYMVTCYEDYDARWKVEGTSMLNNETYPVFKSWAAELLLRWHRQDPVDRKEIARNDSVFKLQQNRNPFIDIPDLAEYIWGNKADETFIVSSTAAYPALMTPSAGVSINFGNVLTSNDKTRSIPVKGVRLSANLTVDFLKNSANTFSVAGELSASDVNMPEGYFLPINYKPTATRKDTAILRINSADLPEPVLVQLCGNGVKTLEVNPVEPSEDMDVMIFYMGSWTKNELPAYMSTNVAGTPYANGDFAFKNNKEYLIVKFTEEPDILQFSIYPRNAWGTNDNHLYVYQAADNENFGENPVADFDNKFVVNGSTYNNTSYINLDKNTRSIKIEYVKKAQNVGINNLIITRKKPANLNKFVDLPSLQVYCSDGALRINAKNRQGAAQVYALTGELVAEVILNEGQTAIPFPQKGVFLLKADNTIYKFIAK